MREPQRGYIRHGNFLTNNKPIKKGADGLWEIPQVHRLCVYASGSLMIVSFDCWIFTTFSRLHFGQNSGKLSRIVSILICVRVLFPQTGHNTHSLSSMAIFITAPDPVAFSSVSLLRLLLHWVGRFSVFPAPMISDRPETPAFRLHSLYQGHIAVR